MRTAQELRSWFPSLDTGFAYLENAGGSQVPRCVADAIRDHMLRDYVQVGAGYPQSLRTTEMLEHAHEFTETIVNGTGVGKAILGSSTTALIMILAEAYGMAMQPGDEVVVAETNHEANIGPWMRLERFGVKTHVWRYPCRLEDLKDLLTDRTRIVAVNHASNLLGEVVDVRGITHLAHSAGARVVVDGVAYAPHRAIDVQALDVDYYLFSCYKVYGPHMAAMVAKNEAIADLEGPNHFFIAKEEVPYKFEPGGVSHEACAGWLALRDYLSFVSGDSSFGRRTVESAFGVMADLERPMTERLLEYLRGRGDLQVVGTDEATSERLGTVSFLPSRCSSPEFVARVDDASIGIRYGSMYAWRLCEALGIDPVTGVVRVSLLHYNTMDEIERLISVMEAI